MIAEDIIEKLFDLYKEQTSDKLNIYMLDVSPKIFTALIQGVDKAKEVKYFECIEKYIR